MPAGIVESIVVQKSPEGFSLRAEVRKSDVRSSTGDVELKEWTFNNLRDLQKQLRTLKNLDPNRSRIELFPATTTPTEKVVLWMDLIRKDSEGPLFNEILLRSARIAPQ